MSIQAMARVIALAGIDCQPKMVLLMIANHVNQSDALAWPKIKRLCEECHLADSTVRKHVAEFKRTGVLQIERGGDRRSNVYWINFEVAEALYGVHDWGQSRPPAPGTAGRDTAGSRRFSRGDTAGHRRYLPPSAGGDTAGDRRYLPPAAGGPIRTVNQPLLNREGEPARAPTPAGGESRAGARAEREAAESERAETLAAYWRERQAAAVEAFGEQAYKAWLSQAVPCEDQDGCFTFATPNEFIARHCEVNFAAELAPLLGRDRVAFVVERWVDKHLARARRKEEAEARDRAAIGDDGEDAA
ncbi:MAG: helix-turn-helix domain-containing protein [Kiloniellales bacterium]|nr:helix-turn-helix domain-containing protein [Kiloniellales bacterium]